MIAEAAAPEREERDIVVPSWWGIKAVYKKVQEAVDDLVEQVRAAGFRAVQLVDVWKEAVRWLLPRVELTVPHKSGGKETIRRVRPGRLAGQAILIVEQCIKGLVPAFFHSQVTIAHEALGLGLVEEGPNKGEPKPAQRLRGGKLQRFIDPPGVRHTREVLRLLERLGFFKPFARKSAEEHEVRREGRTTVRVLQIPKEALEAVKRIFAAREERAARRQRQPSGASVAPSPASPPRGARAPQPVPTGTPNAAEDAAFAELLAAHRAGHALRYREAVEAAGEPYTEALAGTIRPASQPEIGRALNNLARRGEQIAAARCRDDLAVDEIRRELIRRIVTAYLAQDKPRLVLARHPLGWLWGADETKRELLILGERALEDWTAQLEPGEMTLPSAPPADALGAEGAADAGEAAEPAEGSDDEEARRLCAELRTQLGCEGTPAESAGEVGGAAAAPVADEVDLDLAPARTRPGRLSAEVLGELARIDAGLLPAKKPP